MYVCVKVFIVILILVLFVLLYIYIYLIFIYKAFYFIYLQIYTITFALIFDIKFRLYYPSSIYQAPHKYFISYSLIYLIYYYFTKILLSISNAIHIHSPLRILTRTNHITSRTVSINNASLIEALLMLMLMLTLRIVIVLRVISEHIRIMNAL